MTIELWFILAVISALGSGIGNFYNKIAIQKGHNKDLFVIYGVLLTVLVTAILAFVFENPFDTSTAVILLGLVGGLAATCGIIGKLETLQYIDVTIFMPIFKTLSPLIVVLLGIGFFGEWFTFFEAIGIVLSLSIPLLLISRMEKHRQNNLHKGIIFTIFTSLAAAITVLIHKYTTELSDSVLTIITLINIGIALGSIGLFVVKNKLSEIPSIIKLQTNRELLIDSSIRSLVPLGGFIAFMYALTLGGPLGIVYTINSLYVVIPVILSILIYKEHWNLRKACAIVLSVVALIFFA